MLVALGKDDGKEVGAGGGGGGGVTGRELWRKGGGTVKKRNEGEGTVGKGMRGLGIGMREGAAGK